MNQKQSATSSLDFSGYEKTHALRSIFQAAVNLELPLAVWRSPHQRKINLTVSFSKVKEVERPDLETSDKGFIFSPFDPKSGATLFIKSDFHVSFDFDEIIQHEHLTSSEDAHQTEFLESIKQQLNKPKEKVNYHVKDQVITEVDLEYKDLVQLGVDAIKNNDFQKVVPARSKTISLNDNFDLITKYLQLCDAYANAFVSIVSTSETGTWLGATPELLLEVNHSQFKTVALAGTQKRDIDKPISDTAWTQKEIEEQALVSRYIINCFKKIRLREYEEKGPKTVIAGNLLHLKTEFEVNMKETNFPELGTVMLELLHPTSAIAGMPKAASLNFIQQHEGFDRSFYSGYLGPVQTEKQTSIFVNLRCMQLLENKAILYAGAGVTEDSVAQKEFEETEMKFNTLLNILNSEP
ncbi:chorismate-binding protein [Roseivirga sp.]|uniref:chorismate-binding protein n=1 Tax=Roseivirga sp. TaxID=1964215 RepID=UPI002B27BD58|nr:chorismate-binding protein [Roseivirga sp.]